MTFPNFHFAFWSQRIQFQFKHKTLEWRWHDFFHLKWKGVLKIFEFHLEIFQIQKLYATQWFSREKIKWLLQNIWNMSWEFRRIKFKSPFEGILKSFLNLELFGFYSNGRSHVIFSLGFCIWKKIEFSEILNAKWKFEKVLYSLSFNFQKFQISLTFSQSITQQSNKQSKLSIYYNIPKFRILGCYIHVLKDLNHAFRRFATHCK